MPYKVVWEILKLENQNNGKMPKQWENAKTAPNKFEVKRIIRILYIFQVRASFSQKSFHNNAKICTHSRNFFILGSPIGGV